MLKAEHWACASNIVYRQFDFRRPPEIYSLGRGTKTWTHSAAEDLRYRFEPHTQALTAARGYLPWSLGRHCAGH